MKAALRAPTPRKLELPALESFAIVAAFVAFLFLQSWPGAAVVAITVLYAVARRHPRPGYVTALYLVLYAVVRFHTERLRGDARLQVGTLSISQILSLLLLAIGIGVLLVLWIRRRAGRPGASWRPPETHAD